MSRQAVLIGSLTQDPARVDLEALSGLIDVLEIRADRVGDVDTDEIRSRFDGQLLFTLRSRSEGGNGPDDPHERERRILAAADRFDLIDLEAERDLFPEIVDRVPAERRIISWHGERADVDALKARFVAMVREPARWYKLVSYVDQPRDCVAPLVFSKLTGRDDVISFAAGEVASWTRMLAPRLGAPVVYGSVGSRSAAPGQVSIEQLRRDYGLPSLPPVWRLFGLTGHPIAHSLSPRLHNGIYHALGLEHLYVPFDVPVFGDFWLDLVEGGSLEDLGFPLVGLSVTAPFKEIALAVAGASSPLAERIGSANTLVRRGNVWEAESTDPDGVRGPLVAAGIDVAGRRAAILGAGGAGRATVFGLGLDGARVTLVNRTPERGKRVARELGVEFLDFGDFDPADFEIVANATPLGGTGGEDLPFDPAKLPEDGVVIDLAYHPDRPTRLIEETRRLGRLAIDGREALLHQGMPQFRAMNGLAMPLDLARRILGLEPAGGVER
jgi:3-dehydroquinate dehydratase/shikimate dehydrogenase